MFRPELNESLINDTCFLTLLHRNGRIKYVIPRMKTCWLIGNEPLPRILYGNVVNTTCIMMLVLVVRSRKELAEELSEPSDLVKWMDADDVEAIKN